jgi:hypothetical protein
MTSPKAYESTKRFLIDPDAWCHILDVKKNRAGLNDAQDISIVDVCIVGWRLCQIRDRN